MPQLPLSPCLALASCSLSARHTSKDDERSPRLRKVSARPPVLSDLKETGGCSYRRYFSIHSVLGIDISPSS